MMNVLATPLTPLSLGWQPERDDHGSYTKILHLWLIHPSSRTSWAPRSLPSHNHSNTTYFLCPPAPPRPHALTALKLMPCPTRALTPQGREAQDTRAVPSFPWLCVRVPRRQRRRPLFPVTSADPRRSPRLLKQRNSTTLPLHLTLGVPSGLSLHPIRRCYLLVLRVWVPRVGLLGVWGRVVAGTAPCTTQRRRAGWGSGQTPAKIWTSTSSCSSNIRPPCLGISMNLQGLLILVFTQPGKEKRDNQRKIIREKSMNKIGTPTSSCSSNTRPPCLGVHRDLQKLFSLVFTQQGKEKRDNQRIMTGERAWTKN